MSRANYVKQLEHIADASKKAIDDLTREVYELREQLKTTKQLPNEQRSYQKSTNS
jgi:hypothetical protein